MQTFHFLDKSKIYKNFEYGKEVPKNSRGKE